MCSSMFFNGSANVTLSFLNFLKKVECLVKFDAKNGFFDSFHFQKYIQRCFYLKWFKSYSTQCVLPLNVCTTLKIIVCIALHTTTA